MAVPATVCRPGRRYGLSGFHARRTTPRHVWGFENPTETRTRTVDAHACRLRRKLDAAGARHLVVNRRGVGYALTTPNHNRNDNGNANGNGDGVQAT